MHRTLKFIIPVLVVGAPVIVQAESTGRIVGKVAGKDGKPVIGAKITLKRRDRVWTKELVSDNKGIYQQAGLEPVTYDLTVIAEGFVKFVAEVKVPLADSLKYDVTLLTPKEATVSQPANAQPTDEGAALENAGLNAFNENLELYNQGRFAEVLGPFEDAYKSLKDSMAKTTDEKAKAELQPKIDMVERVLGLTYYKVGKKAEAEPLLLKALARKADDQNALIAIVDIFHSKKDVENEKKYQAELDKLIGPRPEIAYNEGVNLFNAGKNKEAKAEVEKALSIDPKFADAYYLLGLIEIGEGKMGAAKVALQKYMELAPNGKKAGEVKGILKELR